MTKHKHHKVIKAWADGAVIECNGGGSWYVLDCPSFFNRNQYRVKPAKPVYEWQWLMKLKRNGLFGTSIHCITVKDVENHYHPYYAILERIEGSKREVKL